MTLNEIGKLIKAERMKKGLSCRELGALSGTSAATVCRVENGKRKTASIATVIKIINALGLNLRLQKKAPEYEVIAGQSEAKRIRVNKINICGKDVVTIGDGWRLSQCEWNNLLLYGWEPSDAKSGSEITHLYLMIEKEGTECPEKEDDLKDPDNTELSLESE